MSVNPAVKEIMMLGAMEVGNRIKNPWLRYGVLGFLLWHLWRMSTGRGTGLGRLPNGWKMNVDSDTAVDMLAPGLGPGTRILAKKAARAFVKGAMR